LTAPPKTRVFVIDDDHSVRRGLSRLLTAAGFRVEAFDSGPAFLSRAPPRGAHCVIIDVRMPGMTGPELFEAMRANGRTSPVVFVTAHGTDEIQRDFPGETVLAKPIEADVLISAIDEAVGRARPARRAGGSRR
jgi:FixJ family two-component response regulator